MSEEIGWGGVQRGGLERAVSLGKKPREADEFCSGEWGARDVLIVKLGQLLSSLQGQGWFLPFSPAPQCPAQVLTGSFN